MSFQELIDDIGRPSGGMISVFPAKDKRFLLVDGLARWKASQIGKSVKSLSNKGHQPKKARNLKGRSR